MTRPPHVLHILNELRFSGAELMLAAAADELGAQNCWIAATGERPGSFAPHLERAGYTVIHAPFEKRPGYFLRLRDTIRSCRPDIVHVHSERAAMWYSLVALSLGIPSVRTVHNEFRFEGALRWRRALTRQVARLSGTRHVACSARVARNEIARFGVRDIRVIDNWIDLARVPGSYDDGRRRAARRALAIPEEALVSLSIGNEAPAKNLPELVRGIAMAGGDTDIRHYHCGAVSDSLRASVPSGLRFRFSGQVTNVADYLAAADIFVSLSLFEGGQLSMIEAAAAGLLCLVTEVGLVEDFRCQPNVVVIQPTGEGVAEALRAVTAGPIGASEALSAFARERYSPERGAEAYIRLYHELMP